KNKIMTGIFAWYASWILQNHAVFQDFANLNFQVYA
ncbi:hypothetical protein AB729_11635, partial [Acinetobacter baumannii]